MLLSEILKKNTDMYGVLYDARSVICGAAPLLDAHGITGRCDMIVGDFFSIGAAGCCHVMKHIIHDWEDDKATRILRNSRAAMNGDGKLLVVAMVVPEGDAPSPSKFLDLEMLLSLHSHERTQKEYAALFASADFKLNRVVPTASRDSSDEGVRV